MTDTLRPTIATTGPPLPKISSEFQEAASAISRRAAAAMRKAWMAGNQELQALTEKHRLPGTYQLRGTSSGRDQRTQQAMLEFVVCWTPPKRETSAAQVEMTLRDL